MTANAISHPTTAFPGRAQARPVSGRLTGKAKLLWVLWLVILFEPHWWVVAVTHVDPIGKLPLVLFALVGLAALRTYPKHNTMTPLLLIVVYALITWRLATNPAEAEKSLKQFLLYWIMAIGMSAFIKTPKQLTHFIMAGLVWQYTWWALLGDKAGRVKWHPAYGNYDGFGPLMVIGAAASFHMGLALKRGPLKLLAFGTSALCVLGVVSAFARGAVLGLGLVLVFAWWRSHRKGAMTLGIIGALVAVTIAASIFAGGKRGRGSHASFWAEMATVADTGGTRSDREVLWGAAMTIWKENKLFGVGGQSFGPYAAFYFKPGEIGGGYSRNPQVLYERKLHNIYVQILCEYGLVGAALFLWLFIEFWRRNWSLQRRPAGVAWKIQGGTLELRAIALGLESAMVAFMGCGYFYNQLEVHWLFSLFALNAVLYEMTVTKPALQARLRRA